MDETQYTPSSPSTKPSSTSSQLKSVLVCVVVILLIAACAGLFVKWQSAKNQVKTLQAQLISKNDTIQTIQTQLKNARDDLRKRDLSLFAGVVSAYNKTHGGHLTTEGSISKSIYDTQLSKSLSNFIDPETGQTYDFVGVAEVQSPPPLKIGVIQYQWPGKCGDKTIVDSNDETQSVVATLLEDGSMYCVKV